ncbi:MAG: DUF5666 domain-containing protein [Terriglobia bacterium]
MKNKLSVFLLVIPALALCATLGMAAQQSAQAQPERGTGRGPAAQGEMARGTISSVGVDRIEIKKMDGTTQVVMVNDQTRYRQGQQDIQLEDLKLGDRVFVRGRANDNKEFVALGVRRVTDEEAQRFQSGPGGGNRTGGQIVSIEGNQLKIQNPRQGERLVLVTDQTTFMKDGQPITLKDLKVGDRVFAVGQEVDGKFTATRIMSGPFRRGGGQRQRGPGQEPNNP